jgi:hypothetical protein
MGPKQPEQPSFDFEDEQETLPLADVLQHADEIAEHEETDEEMGL